MFRVLLLLLMFISIWSTVYPSNGPRIINGEDSPEGRWPFMVSVQKAGGHFCGGSILNDDSILTAAHCVMEGHVANETRVLIGTVKTTNPDSKFMYQVKQFFPNTKFTKKNLSNGHDVAVIKLDRSINFEEFKGKVDKICLPDSSDEPLADKCIALGWGLTKAGSASTPATLRQVDLPIMPENACDPDYDRKVIYCAGYKDGNKATCNGDSGSPVMCLSKSDPQKYLQFGITSYGNKIECSSFGYYTKPAAFLDFIREKAESYN